MNFIEFFKKRVLINEAVKTDILLYHYISKSVYTLLKEYEELKRNAINKDAVVQTEYQSIDYFQDDDKALSVALKTSADIGGEYIPNVEIINPKVIRRHNDYCSSIVIFLPKSIPLEKLQVIDPKLHNATPLQRKIEALVYHECVHHIQITRKFDSGELADETLSDEKITTSTLKKSFEDAPDLNLDTLSSYNKYITSYYETEARIKALVAEWNNALEHYITHKSAKELRSLRRLFIKRNLDEIIKFIEDYSDNELASGVEDVDVCVSFKNEKKALYGLGSSLKRDDTAAYIEKNRKKLEKRKLAIDKHYKKGIAHIVMYYLNDLHLFDK